MNMRSGVPAAVFESAVLFGNWGRDNVEDLDFFFLYEAGFRMLADDLAKLGCPNRTIVKLFNDGLPENELKQLKWYLRGFPFPRKFTDPEACKERRKAAFATFFNRRWSAGPLRNLLRRRGAEDVAAAIGIDFTTFPPRRIKSDLVEQARKEEDGRDKLEKTRQSCERSLRMYEAIHRGEQLHRTPRIIPPTPPYLAAPPKSPANRPRRSPSYQPPPFPNVEPTPRPSITTEELLRHINGLSVRSAAEDVGESVPSSFSIGSSSAGSSRSNPVIINIEDGEVCEDANCSPGEV